MNFYAMALELEEKLTRHYANLAQQCVQHPGIQSIVGLLERDHSRHIQALTQMQQDECDTILRTDLFARAAAILKELKDKGEAFTCDIDQRELYQQALEITEEKVKLYRGHASMMQCPENRAKLQEIAREEEYQTRLLKNIIEMISKPQQWVEDAEFYHFEEY
jgi:demethoxyubiquinone hydroxylase (CLK1/Coq7/Cat5 family)